MEAVRFLVIYSNVLLLLSAFSTANRVDQINQLLIHPGWSDLGSGHYCVGIFERWRGSQNRITAHDLIAKGPNTQIVTGNNAETKFRQVHQLLSCRYVNVIKKFSDYQRGIGPICKGMTDSFKSFECLKILTNVIKENDTILLPMQASLLWFVKMSPITQFPMDVSVILGYFKSFYDSKTVDSSTLKQNVTEETIIRIVKTESREIEEYMSEMVGRLSTFFNDNCWSPPYHEGKYGISEATAYVQDITARITAEFAPYEIINKAKEVINTFLNAEFEDLGFIYDSTSNLAQIIISDPDQLRRVEQMNRILGNDGWEKLGAVKDHIHILNNSTSSDYTTVNKLLELSPNRKKIVTKHNLSTKVHQAYQFLCCKHATILKKICDFMLTILNKIVSDLTETLNIFLEKVKNVHSLVSHLHNALLYVYQMSPDILFNLRMSEILGDFMVLCDGVTFEKYSSDEIAIVKTNISVIQGNVKIYFRQSCYPYAYHMEGIRRSLKNTYDAKNIINNFQNKIYKFEKTAVYDFGFMYNPVNNTVELRLW